MTEKDPTLRLNLSEGRHLDLSPHNTVMYTFLGHTAIGGTMFENSSANHAFVQTGKNEHNQPTGMYFFERFHPVYREIASFALANAFPLVANQRTVPACDLRAYMDQADLEGARFAAALEGVLPEDF